MADNQALIEELKAKHQDKVEFWEYEDFGLVAVARPADPETAFREYYDHHNSPNLKQSSAIENLAFGAVVYPEDQEMVIRIANEWPDDVYAWWKTVLRFLGEGIEPGDDAKAPGSVKELKKQHKRIAWWDVPGVGIVAASKPKDRHAYHEAVDGIAEINSGGDGSRYDVNKAFALACVISPEIATVELAFKQHPGLAILISNAGRALCQSGSKRLGKA